MPSDLDQITANDTEVLGACESGDCTNSAVGRHGYCSVHKPIQGALGEILPGKEKLVHKLGCDEMHGHMAPKCCSPDCYCLPLLNFELDPNTALSRWSRIDKKLTEGQREHIDSFAHTLETCLKFSNGRVWLGLEAKAVLAWEFYKADDSEERPKPKGRREAIEHTRRQNEAEDE